MDERKRDANFENFFVWLLTIAVGIFAIVALAYYIHFGIGHPLSPDSKDWAEFGEYMGGTLGGVFGLLAFMGLLITIVQQRGDNERIVKATLDAVTKAHFIETESQRKSILAIADAANEHARRISDALARSDNAVALYDVYDKSIVDGVVRALTDIPVHQVGSRDGVLALLSLRDQFVFLGLTLEAFLAGPGKDPLTKEMLDTLKEPEDRQTKMAVIAASKLALTRNVQMHLDKIRENHESLEAALGES